MIFSQQFDQLKKKEICVNFSIFTDSFLPGLSLEFFGGGQLVDISKNKEVHKDQRSSALSYYLNSKPHTDTRHLLSCNHQKWLPYQIIGVKTVKNVQIDDSKINEQFYGQTNNWIARWKSGQIDGQLDRQNYSWLAGRID